MNGIWRTITGACALGAVSLCLPAAQAGQAPAAQQSQPAQQNDKDKTPKAGEQTPLTLDNAPAPVNAEEDAAYKALLDPAVKDPNVKIQQAQDFLAKYPQSRYKSPVLSILTNEYLQVNQVPKAVQAGEQELEVNPNDVQVLSVLSQAMARVHDPKAPDASARLEKAERYAKRAIEVTPTLPKPPQLSDELFVREKNVTLAMAHGALGLVEIRRNRFSEAIPELDQAVKVDPDQDPVNYYLLGKANEASSHFDEAAAAYNKCAAIQGQLQATCKAGADDAKKKSGTQLSAPK